MDVQNPESRDHSQDKITPDADQESFVDRLPEPLRPWLRLMRADRPVGTWLLWIPCMWGLTLAWADGRAVDADLLTVFLYSLLFGIGAFVMRSAGCVYNDIVDRDIDAKVERTANRPIASGRITVMQASILLVGLCLVGLLILLLFNQTTRNLGFASLALVAIYPFMKRITWWPQVWLGLTFNWGALMGWTAITGTIDWPAAFLYAAGVLWTIGYDTIYAHQDREDDALVGVKSTARLFGEKSALWIGIFYSAAIFMLFVALSLTRLNHWSFVIMLAAILHLLWQQQRFNMNDGGLCLKLFKANRNTGLLILAALFVGGIH